MSSKSTQHPHSKHFLSKKVVIFAIVMAAIFLTIILVYPGIFGPATGANTKIAPINPIPATGTHP